MKKILLLSAVVFSTIYAKAQQDLTIYYMDNVPQRAYQNPAFRPNARWNLGLPVISSIYTSYTNTTFTPKNLFSADGTTLMLNDFKTKIKTNNYVGLNAKVDLLSFGFRIKQKNYLTFNVTENIFARVNMPGGLLRFPLEGNVDANGNGKEFSFKNLELNAVHYREYGVGFQRIINDKLNVGVKVKYLYGMENIYTKKSDFNLITGSDAWDISITGGLDVKTSGIQTTLVRDSNNNLVSSGEKMDIEENNVTSYLFGRNNHGLGFDLGGEYQVNNKIKVNASVLDLGFIRWNQYQNQFAISDVDFAYAGIDLTEAIYAADSNSQDSVDAAVERLLNQVTGEDVRQSGDPYRTPLLTRLNFGGTYQLYEAKKHKANAGLLIQTEIYHKRIRPSFTLSYNQSVGRWLNASLSYSVINTSWQNIGAGLSLNLGPVQYYIVADNLLAANMTTFTDNGQTKFMHPTSAKYVQIHTGLNLTIRDRKDRDNDGIVDRKDECPDVFGLAEFNGCPDTDGDGFEDKVDNCPETPGTINGCPDDDNDSIINLNDSCPDIAGLAKFNGCPDTDGDGIMDKEDNCPEIAGLAKFNGCPDTDGDGVMDKEDSCPDIAGLAMFNGCPDADGDGIMDSEDACPSEFGPKENKGCPWGDKDGDGVLDNVDKCPDVPGEIVRNGCPDTDKDGDGVLDAVDKCPNVPGTVENNGCPEIKKEEAEVLKRAFDNLEFESGKAIIKTSSYTSLNELSDLLKANPTWKIMITGHTDNVGAEAANLTLSKNRALAVKKYLVNKWVVEENVRTEWYGETKPIATNDTPEGRQQNRRVEMEIQFE